MVTLKYADERDRAYGLGGMAACLVFLENEDFIESVSLDAPADCGLVLSPEFYYAPNQHLSAKSVWKENLNHFEVVAGLLVSNVLSRALVRHRIEMSRELADLLLSRLKEEGRELCALDDDEVKDIFYKTYNYFHRVFSNDEVARIMDGMVDKFVQERVLEKESILQLFRAFMRR